MRLIVAVAAIAFAGCASFDGGGLVPGKATEQDVVALMGTPADRIKLADGDTMLYFPRQPTGNMMYGARMAPNGTLRSIEQLLTEQNIARIVRDVTTRDQVREIVGPPWRTTRLERQQRDVWEYNMLNITQDYFFLYVQMSYDGVVRELMMLKDYSREFGDPRS